MCQTTDPEFLWMNEAMLVFSGTANLGTSKLQAVARVLTPEIVLSTRLNKGTISRAFLAVAHIAVSLATGARAAPSGCSVMQPEGLSKAHGVRAP
jgi:hypothetical protein